MQLIVVAFHYMSRQQRGGFSVNRNQKTDLVNTLHNTFEGSASVVIVHCVGLTVAESTDLRTKMRDENCNFKVTKNRIARIALKDTKYQHLESMFSGPTAIGSSEDPVMAAKILVDFAKNNEKLKIVGGGLEDKPLSKTDVEALAKLPSLNDLRGKLVGLIQAPATKLLRVIIEPASQVLRTIAQKSKQ
jgi:large subunit ribosomal protein L10